MIKKLKDARIKFVNLFKYSPEFPPDLYFDQEEYAELLLKCIEDDFDYTIEKYGTVVPKKMPRPENNMGLTATNREIGGIFIPNFKKERI